jgi:hypothetical protein
MKLIIYCIVAVTATVEIFSAIMSSNIILKVNEDQLTWASGN